MAFAPTIITAPVEIDPTDLVTVNYDLNNDKLSSTLQRFAATVSRNARVTNQTMEQSDQMKNFMEVNMNKIQRMVNVIDDSTRLTREAVSKVQDEMAVLKASTVTKRDFDHEKQMIWAPLKRAELFVDEVEGGQTERVQRIIKKYCDDFVPRWYDPINEALWSKIDGELTSLRDGYKQKIHDDIRHSEGVVQAQVEKGKADFMEGLEALERQTTDQTEALKDLVATMKEEVVERLAVVSSAQGDIPSALLETVGPRLDQADVEIDALKQMLGLGPGVSAAALLQGGSSSEGQLSGTSSPAQSRSVSPTFTQHPPVAAVSSGGVAPPMAATVRLAQTQQQQQLATRRGTAPSTLNSSSSSPAPYFGRSASPSSHLFGLAGGSRSGRSGGTMNLSGENENTVSSKKKPKTSLKSLINSGPFMELKQQIMVQHAEVSQSNQDHVDRALFDMRTALHKDLADKVGMATLQELLYKYRDEALYTQVKNNSAELQRVRAEKVDASVMQNLLNGKAEKLDLDTKVEMSYLNTVQLQNEGRIEEMTMDCAGIEGKVKEDRTKIQVIMDILRSLNTGAFDANGNLLPMATRTTYDEQWGLVEAPSQNLLHHPPPQQRLNSATSRGHTQPPPMTSSSQPALEWQRPGGGASPGTTLSQNHTSGGSPGAGGSWDSNRNAKITTVPGQAGAPPSSKFPQEYKETQKTTGGRMQQQRFSELLFRTKPEEYAKGKTSSPKH